MPDNTPSSDVIQQWIEDAVKAERERCAMVALQSTAVGSHPKGPVFGNTWNLACAEISKQIRSGE